MERTNAALDELQSLPAEHLPERVKRERDRILAALGDDWPKAVLATVGRWAFDYAILLASLAAVGAHPAPGLVLLAFCVAQVLAQTGHDVFLLDSSTEVLENVKVEQYQKRNQEFSRDAMAAESSKAWTRTWMELLVNLILVMAAAPLGQLSTAAWLTWSLGAFFVGWLIQFIGHYYEGRKPAFMDDLRGLLIGPMFVTGEAMFALGWGKAMLAEIESRVGPTHLRDLHAPAAR